jgi:LacI family transcriptional regulator
LQARGVDGAILSTITKDDPIITQLVEDQFPIVCVNRFSMDPALGNRIDHVILDNYTCGDQGIEHLYRLGHDRIAIITGTLSAATAFMRTKGSTQAMDDYGLARNPR